MNTQIIATHITTGEILIFMHVADVATFFNVTQNDVILALQGANNSRVKAYKVSYKPSNY